jgi:hypothetical protein
LPKLFRQLRWSPNDAGSANVHGPLMIKNHNSEWMEHENALTVSAFVGLLEMTVRKNTEELVITDYILNIR